jgi:hypothetical protein
MEVFDTISVTPCIVKTDDADCPPSTSAPPANTLCDVVNRAPSDHVSVPVMCTFWLAVTTDEPPNAALPPTVSALLSEPLAASDTSPLTTVGPPPVNTDPAVDTNESSAIVSLPGTDNVIAPADATCVAVKPPDATVNDAVPPDATDSAPMAPVMVPSTLR